MTKVIQLRVSEDLVESIKQIKKRLHVETMTSAIKSSIALADMLTKAMEKGEHVLIEKKNGKHVRVLFPGLG